MNIWDNPDHLYYGQVRRMWKVLVQLDLLDWCEANYPYWAEALVSFLHQGVGESEACRFVLWQCRDAGAR